MKTKRDFLFKATSFVPIGDFIQLETVYIEKAMQEHTDQAIAEFKRKLKEIYAEEFDFPHTSIT